MYRKSPTSRFLSVMADDKMHSSCHETQFVPNSARVYEFIESPVGRLVVSYIVIGIETPISILELELVFCF